MDEPYLLAATRYVERNPVKAKLVRKAADWPWSSAAARAAGRADELVETEWLTELTAGWVCSWSQYLRGPDEPALAKAMQRCENTGRPLGEERFLGKLEKELGRRLIPRKAGRPPKEKK